MALSPAEVLTAGPGRHCDGGDGGATGLYLHCRDGRRWWCYRFRTQGRVREAGLGSAAVVGLTEARDRARELYAIVRQGRDPIAEGGSSNARQRSA